MTLRMEALWKRQCRQCFVMFSTVIIEISAAFQDFQGNVAAFPCYFPYSKSNTSRTRTSFSDAAKAAGNWESLVARGSMDFTKMD
eukprot:scaffold170098_cov10-Prasinocladus_malaysianus.AAC.1